MSTQRSFGAGELAPAFHARTDHERYVTGLATCRNFYIRKSGGAISRPGTKYVGESRYTDKKVRLIPWIFSESQAYVIEIGDALIRIIDSTTQDYLFTATQAITAITNASPGVVTITGHGYATDDVIKIESVGGMTELNDRFLRVLYIGANTFSLKEMDGTAINTTAYGTYVSGGTAKEPYSIAAANSVVPDTVPFDEGTLEYITFAQSGDVMTLCHTNHIPRDLVRFDGGVTEVSWRLLTKSFGSSLTVPSAGPTFEDEPAGTEYQQSYFTATAVADSGDESLVTTILDYAYTKGDPDAFALAQVPIDKGTAGDAFEIDFTTVGKAGAEGTSITQTSPDDGVAYGAYVIVTDILGHDWSGNHITIKGLTHDGSVGSEKIDGPHAYSRVSFLSPYRYIEALFIDGLPDVTAKLSVGYDSLEIFPVKVTVGASIEDTVTRYRLYRADVFGTITIKPAFGFVDEAFEVTGLIDRGGVPDYTRPPPVALYTPDGNAMFTTASNRPGVVGYYQQRLILSRSLYQPESVWMSRTGLYYVANSLGKKTGTGDSFTNAAGTITFVDAGATGDNAFAASDVGLFFHVYGATSPANNGRFAIVSRVSGTSITYANAVPGVTEAFTGTWRIVPENFANFNISYPTRDDNAIQFAIASSQLDRPWHFLDLGRLIIFTDSGEWIVEGDSAGVITPTQINPRKISHAGSTYIRPLVVANTALFVQGNRKTVRDLVYDQQSTGYQGNDLTVFSQHLFDGVTIADWTYQQDPDSLVWIVLSDGDMLSMSYLKDFNQYGWARHDTPGTSAEFVSVCSVPDGSGVDDVYVAVKRTINGRTFRSIEVMSDRFDTTDSHLVQTDATVVIDNSATDANLKAWWKMDETSAETDAGILVRLEDSSGNGFHGLPQASGGPWIITDGKIDGARGMGRRVTSGVATPPFATGRFMDCDGYNTPYGGTPANNSNGSLSFDPCTWEGWVRIYAGATGSEMMVGTHNNFQGGPAWTINFDQSGGAYKLSISLTFDDAPTYTVETLKDTGFNTAADTWTHIGFTWDGTWFRIYVDGVNVNSSNANAANSMWFTPDWGYHPRLGASRQHSGGSDNSYFDGDMDHWRAHNVARAPSWFRSAAAKIEGLWHLEGEDVSVLGDGNIIASPYNSDYDTVTVANGSVTLPSAYGYTVVGLPVVNDLKTLDLDPPDRPGIGSVHGEQKLSTRVTMGLDRSSRCWVGVDDPGTDGALTNLEELDIHAEVGGTTQTSGSTTLASKVVDQQVDGDWNSHGRVFVRNVDPIPLHVLSITPHILAGPRGRGRR